jgi:quercetin dioxygenase-like cupin family protein
MYLKGPCGEKVGHYTDVIEENVPSEMASGTTIRWLVRKEDGAPTFAMRLFKVAPGGHINAHRHPWEHEIYVVRGKGRVRIGSANYTVNEGFFIYIPPNVEHEYWNTGDDDLLFICVIPHGPTVPEEKVEC